MTFREPVVESSSERNVEDHTAEPPVTDIETWLEWQAKQLDTPAWWPELKAILGVKDLQKLAHKIRASFYIPEVRMRLPQTSSIPHPLPPNALAEMPSSWMSCHTRTYINN